ncbi:MAG: TRAP transporter large permease [Anaerolineales bacterium]|nr:TRAP transporter large permease [Anaerolineales bacterium]MCB1463058.1 TRAP transporter large permease [Nitratireductor sp.]
MLLPLFVFFFVLTIIGVPIVFAIGIAGAFTYLVFSELPGFVIAQKMIGGMDSFPILAVPFFVFAGVCMEAGGISQRIVNFANCVVGAIRGGLAQVAIMASMIFAGISGSGVADASAVGSVLIPSMRKKGFSPAFSAALIAAAGSIGMIIPPSLLMIIYGSLTGVSIGAMFVGGIIPGFLVGAGLMIYTFFYARRNDYPVEPLAKFPDIWRSFRGAFWALLTPVLIVGGILGGIFTATEAGAVTAVYTLFISLFVYREMKPGDIKEVFTKSAVITSTVLLILSFATIFSYILALEQVPQAVRTLLLSFASNKYVVLTLILCILIVLGCVIETMVIIIILVPVIAPIGAMIGFDPVQFGVLMVIALNLGGITPPVGVLLFLTSSLAGTKLSSTSREILPIIPIFLVVMAIIVIFPATVTYLPSVFLK